MAAQQHQQQPYFPVPQANVRRVNEVRFDGPSAAGAAMGAPNLATAACKQSSSSSFGSPIMNESTALEQREEPMLPSTQASDTGMAASKVLRLLQQQQGHRQERCLTVQQHQVATQLPGHTQLSDEEVASHQQGGRVLPPLRLDNGTEACNRAAIRGLQADTACQSADATFRQDGHHCRPIANSLGRSMDCSDPAAGPTPASSYDLPCKLPTTSLINRQDMATFINSLLLAPNTPRGPQLQQQQQSAATVMHGTPLRQASPGGMNADASMPGSVVTTSTGPQMQLRQLHLQQQQLKLRQQLQQQQIFQKQGDMQQEQLSPCAPMSSNLLGNADRLGTVGLEAQVRARLGLPPKRNHHQAGHTGSGPATLGAAGSPSAASLGPISGHQVGPELGWGTMAAGQIAKMRLMAAVQQSSQTSSPSMSCSASQATMMASMPLHNGRSNPNETLSGLGQAGGVNSELLLGSSPSGFPTQQQQHRRQHELLLQRLSMRQAVLRGSSPNVLSQPGGPASAPLERAYSAPQAALETQIAAVRLQKLEQMGISPSQAVLAVAAGARLPGVQTQLACRTSQGYASAGVSNAPSEMGSPISGRSYKRSAADRCWEEQLQQQLLQQQQQLQVQQRQLEVQQKQDLTGVPEEVAGVGGVERHIGAGVCMATATRGGDGDALQALKRSKAYSAHELLAPPARGFALQAVQQFDSAPLQSQHQRPEMALVCRSMPKDIHGSGIVSSPGNGGAGGFNPRGAGILSGGVNTTMDEMCLPVSVSLLVPLQTHPGEGLDRAQGLGAGPSASSGGLSSLEGSGAGAMIKGGVNSMANGLGIGMMQGAPNSLLERNPGIGFSLARSRPSVSCSSGCINVDGLGPMPSVVPRCSDAVMDLADLVPESDYLADTELQSFIAELCGPAPESAQHDSTTGAVGLGPTGLSSEGTCTTGMAMADGMADGANGMTSVEGTMPGAGAGGTLTVVCSGPRAPHLAFDEEQRALQTEAEALLNFSFD
ncbi:hypothetical protein VaNZ11_015351 [Volvox africanus]|uniref:Uncharacterized protein n=1 Tax=Volvox africanus TaxID=51714 RepID=A0ABQ5SKC4_9CHLO|nr:hypothetical protein VaNZ11_015351 [Volvox africanus]